MTSDAPLSSPPPSTPVPATEATTPDGATTPPPSVSITPTEIDPNIQVRFKTEGGRLLLMLPPEGESSTPEEAAPLSLSWMEIWQQLKQRLNAEARFWQPNTTVHLIARDRLLDARQLQEISAALSEAQLHLKRVFTSRRQTAVAAATAGYSVEQQSHVAHLNQSSPEAGQALEEPLYLQTTLRSGSEIRHNGTVIILGDLNPGSTVVAAGDILIWGRLRGVAHAGSKGNARCRIMALQMEPTQIRIADFVARAPETPPAQYYPEVAYVAPQGVIRIARASDFVRREES